jgi:hypothetical protein
MSEANFRALCAELVVALKSWSPHGGGPLECWEDREEEAALIARACAALAQPEPVAPTDDALDELYFDNDAGRVASWRQFARAVLTRWGTP